jgi:hypothetical protein
MQAHVVERDHIGFEPLGDVVEVEGCHLSSA